MHLPYSAVTAGALPHVPIGAPMPRSGPAVPPAYLRVVRQAGESVQDGAATLELAPTGPDIGWARWRGDGGAVRFEPCRYGLRPLYYHAAPDRFLIAPSIATLLALGAPTELDAAAVAVYLRFENFLGEDTPFKHIRALPPAATLRWDGTLSVRGTLHRPPPQPIARAVAAAEYGRRFPAAIERAASAPVVVPLSGGFDSRHTAPQPAPVRPPHGRR